MDIHYIWIWLYSQTLEETCHYGLLCNAWLDKLEFCNHRGHRTFIVKKHVAFSQVFHSMKWIELIKVIILNQNREKWGINTNKKKCFYDVQNVKNYCFVFPKIVQVRTWYIIYYRVPKGKILPFKCTYLSMFKNILT